MYTQIKAQQKAESEQQRAAYEQLREMVMNMAQGGTCALNPLWSYDHQPHLLLQLHLYINL